MISWPPPVFHNFFHINHFAKAEPFLQLGCFKSSTITSQELSTKTIDATEYLQ